jgi:hypothetical protein
MGQDIDSDMEQTSECNPPIDGAKEKTERTIDKKRMLNRIQVTPLGNYTGQNP